MLALTEPNLNISDSGVVVSTHQVEKGSGHIQLSLVGSHQVEAESLLRVLRAGEAEKRPRKQGRLRKKSSVRWVVFER